MRRAVWGRNTHTNTHAHAHAHTHTHTHTQIFEYILTCTCIGLWGLGVVWGVSKLLRERAHSHFRIKELELTAEAAGLLAAAERLKTEQVR